MSKKIVFNQSVNIGTEYVTESLADASAFYVSAPDIADEIIVEFYLQFEATASNNQGIQLTPEPIANSIFIYLIPQEFRNTGFNLYGLIKSQVATTIEVWAVIPEVSLEQINEKIDQLREDLITEINENETAIGINQLFNSGIIGTQIGQLQGLTLLATTLAPVTAGTSLTSAAAFEVTATSATALLAGGIL